MVVKFNFKLWQGLFQKEKAFRYRRFIEKCPCGLSKCSFVKQRCPFIEVKTPLFMSNFDLILFILNKQFLNFS